jgi:hypothetical protein
MTVLKKLFILIQEMMHLPSMQSLSNNQNDEGSALPLHDTHLYGSFIFPCFLKTAAD